MFCPNCGGELKDGAKFCPNCGAAISGATRMRATVDDAFDDAEGDLNAAVKDVADTLRGDQTNGSAERLQDNRGLLSYILLSVITCGIYSWYFIWKMAHDVNIACDGDGQKTGGLVKYILLSLITCNFYNIYWQYSLGNRLQENAPRYGMTFSENGTSILLWDIVGVLLCGLGPFVAMNILIKNSNRICNAYNRRNFR